MKKSFIVGLITLSVGLFSAVNAHAQDTTTAGRDIKNAAKKTGKAIKRDAKKVGNKTAEIASSGKSAIVDKVYKGKVGPEGEKIYIDGSSKYYFVDDKGHKQYVEKSKLRDK
jgi:hypothetical protein